MTAPLTYWSSGGEVCAARRPLALDDAHALLRVHLDEARAAVVGGATQHGLRALDLATQMHAAILRSHRWRAATGPSR